MSDRITLADKEYRTIRNEDAGQGKVLNVLHRRIAEPDPIERVRILNVMGISDITMDISKGITVIHGENGTGKTAVLKSLYCMTKPLWFRNNDDPLSTKIKTEEAIVDKVKHVFRPDNGAIGNIVYRHAKNERLHMSLEYRGGEKTILSWGKQASEHIDFETYTKKFDVDVVYIPPKEIISASENFMALYKKYMMAFEEMYFDLLELLEMPERRVGVYPVETKISDWLSAMLGGKVVLRDGKYFVDFGRGNICEMGLLSEGYRKIAVLLQLVRNGSLRKGSLLIWDEPESNMNPRMIEPLVDIMVMLGKLGIQIVIASHDYFIQQELQLRAEYPDSYDYTVPISFVSLYKEEGMIQIEQKDRAYKLEHNSIMREFDEIYEREQELIGRNNGRV